MATRAETERILAREGAAGQQYSVDSARWRMLGLTFSLYALAFMPWASYPSMQAIMQRYYETSSINVRFLSWSGPLLYVPGTLLAFFVKNRLSSRRLLLLVASALTLGAFLRLLSTSVGESLGFGVSARYSLAMLGNVVAGLAGPLMTNSHIALARDWFAAGSIYTVASLVQAALPFGLAMGLFFPSVTMAEGGDDPGADLAKCALTQLLMCGGVGLATLVAYRDAPSMAPSSRAAEWRKNQSSWLQTPAIPPGGEMRDTVRELWSDADFRRALVAYSLQWGSLLAVAFYIEEIISLGEYTKNSGLVGALLFTVGAATTALVGVFNNPERAASWRALKGFSVAGAVAMCLFMYSTDLGWRSAGAILVGMALVPAAHLTRLANTECTCPASEEITARLLTLGALGATFVLCLPLSLLFASCEPITADCVELNFAEFTVGPGLLVLAPSVAALIMLRYQGVHEHSTLDVDICTEGRRESMRRALWQHQLF